MSKPSSILATVQQELRNAGLTAAVVTYHPAEPGTDAGINVALGGVDAFSLQIGRGYLGVNRYLYDNEGELDGLEHLYFGKHLDIAVTKLVATAAAEAA